jgi:hypothetical protein
MALKLMLQLIKQVLKLNPFMKVRLIQMPLPMQTTPSSMELKPELM